MKFVKKNLVVIITASIFLIGVITKRASALFVSLFFIGVIVPIVVVTKNDWGKMFLWGIFLTILVLFAFIMLCLLSQYNDWLRSVIVWPQK